MKKNILFLHLLAASFFAQAQNVGIGTTTPQATLDVKGNSRLGGTTNAITHDTVSGKIVWQNSNLFVPVTQRLIQHSAAADGLFYNNTAPVSGQLEYRNAAGNPVFFTNFTNGNGYFANNLGISNLTPQFPISLNGSLGDKISLWTDGSPTHYGLGVQPGLLQIFSKTNMDNIGIGYGNSSNFAERVRIINNGGNGMMLNGRLHLKNGSAPLDPNESGGVWLYKADNSALLGFMGTQNNQNIGFYGGPAGWGFTYDAVNSRVGIGNQNPNAPLSFPAALGKKITLYPGATGDVGFGVSGNRLQIYSDNPSADVAIGYDAAGTFNERFAVKPNGALAINGNTGSAGQVLMNDVSGVPQWTSLNTVSYYIGQATQGGVIFWLDESGQHGLVSSTIDQDLIFGGPGVRWWIPGPSISINPLRKDGIYIGQLNTDSLLSRLYALGATGIAASYCSAWLGGSNETHYGDWYLPSLTELKLLQTQSALVTQVAIFPFASANYWSSTELNAGSANVVHFGTGATGTDTKTNLNRVRAIRRF
jgi:hypothetical protein